MTRILPNLILTVAIAVTCLAALVVFNRAAAPQAKLLPLTAAEFPDYRRIIAAVNPESLRQDLSQLCAGPSRFTATPGCDAAAEFVADELRAAGYTVISQPFRTTVPATRFARILDNRGNEIDGIGIAPLVPNRFRTATTPPDGLSGTVYVGDKGLAREFEGVDLENQIVMLPLGTSWYTVAGMGVAAVLYHDDGRRLPTANWPHNLNVSLNVPRFLVTGDALALKGREITVTARVDYGARPVRNVIGILDVLEATEAVVIGTFYDAYSYTPDLAPGAEQAAGMAAVLAAARQLVADRAALKRAVVIVATAGHGQALAGIREFAAAVGNRDRRDEALEAARGSATDARDRLAVAERVAAITRERQYWNIREAAAEQAFWSGRDGILREKFTEIVHRVLDADLLAAIESVTQARLTWVRNNLAVRNSDGSETAAFAVYNDARKRQRQILAMLASPLFTLKSAWGAELEKKSLPARVPAAAAGRVIRLRRQLEEAEGRAATAATLAAYRQLLFLGIDLSAQSDRLALISSGDTRLASQCQPADTEVMAQLHQAGIGLDQAARSPVYVRDRKRVPRIRNLVREGDELGLSFTPKPNGTTVYFQSKAMLMAGHTAFSIVTLDDSRERMGTPFDTLDNILTPAGNPAASKQSPLDNLTITARLLTAAVNQLARGHGHIVPVAVAGQTHAIRGRIVSRVGNNLTPDHPVPYGLVCISRALAPVPGMGQEVCVQADADGRFRFEGFWPRSITYDHDRKVDLDAALVDPVRGDIVWALSEPDSGSKKAFSVTAVKFAHYRNSEATPVLFRAAAVQLVPMMDPQSSKPYADVGMLDSKSGALPQKYHFEKSTGIIVCYVPPETRLYFTFKKGSRHNPNITVVRAFALGAAGAADGTDSENTAEISGNGYLAADTPRLVNIEFDTALSMAQVNSKRVRRQERYHIADELVLGYNRKAVEHAEAARRLQDAGRIVAGKKAALASLAYSSNIHPVIRRNTADAIWGILFYLMLAVPFAICIEKLLIGHPDIRWQIFYHGIIFIVFFLALRILHPAYELVRSPYMILLGFLTFVLAAAITAFIVNRFGSNIGELQQKLRQQAMVTDISRTATIVTAVLLGLEHMRKRPVRTGITVGTLVLTTFVMLSFTSLTTDIVDMEFAVGKAPYAGLLVRDQDYGDMSATLNPMQELYGNDHIVVERAWGGIFAIKKGKVVQRADFVVASEQGDRRRAASANAYLGLSRLEPEITPVTKAFEVLQRWFERDDELSCFLPRRLADELMIDDADVLNGTAAVTIGSVTYAVRGIFNGKRITDVLDLDGESLLPVDVLGLLAHGTKGISDYSDTVPENIDRLPGSAVVITPVRAMPKRSRAASVAIAFQDLNYAGARALIDSHLERTGQPAYYGLDGIAFYGGKYRRQSVDGMLALLLPLVIAMLTVLNTMRGSVYERRDELYVFNAIGLSPAHIRALFTAEAFVYAVTGAVGGYLLAQGTGVALQAMGMTAGLTPNYSSMSSLIVTVVIMAAVLASSIFPARMAARLAAPAELMTRERRTAAGDAMEFDLPFTFNRRDRIAIVPYFQDWFEDYGEGSNGAFFCDKPTCGIKADTHDRAAAYVRAMTWLRPYDLGVSQDVELLVRHLPDTGDNVATVVMTRTSGDHESWERCCHAFIGLLRKRFLTWRDVAGEDRDRLFERGREMLAPEPVNSGQSRGPTSPTSPTPGTPITDNHRNG